MNDLLSVHSEIRLISKLLTKFKKVEEKEKRIHISAISQTLNLDLFVSIEIGILEFTQRKHSN